MYNIPTNEHSNVAYEDAVKYIREHPRAFDRVWFHRSEQEREDWGKKLGAFEKRFSGDFPMNGDRDFCREYLTGYLFLYLNGPSRIPPPPPKMILLLEKVLKNVLAKEGENGSSMDRNVKGQINGGLDPTESVSSSQPIEEDSVPRLTKRPRTSQNSSNTPAYSTPATIHPHRPLPSTLAPIPTISASPLSQAALASQDCQECRRKHRTCDKQLPNCGLCTRTRRNCVYGGTVAEARAKK
ncbi:hypothetical protein BDZ45DRAFT_697328 [Acephala macrosclerotiorum]|nr:hypothetical protein BDZ45DRAFT_697328 [Acephala macrosclerotiorum]